MKARFWLAHALLAAASAQAADVICLQQVKDFAPAARAAVERTLGETIPSEACTRALLSGPIIPGDAERIKRAFAESEGFLEGIDLNSPGGDIREAMEIGRFARKALLSTGAPMEYRAGERFYPPIGSKKWNPCENAECLCASACFVVWAGGINRVGRVLGIHRPRFDPAYFSGISLEAAQREYGQALIEVKHYFEEMSVPESYYDRMMKTPSADLTILTKEEADKLSVDDYPPAIDEWLISKCGAFRATELRAMLDQSLKNEMLLNKWTDIRVCRAKVILHTKHEIWRKLFPAGTPRNTPKYRLSDTPLDFTPIEPK